METIINEKPCLVEAKQGFSVSYKNKLLYSKYNPISPIEKSIDNLIIQDGTLVLAFSPVLGYGLDLLISKIQKNSFLFLIENDFSLYDFFCYVFLISIKMILSFFPADFYGQNIFLRPSLTLFQCSLICHIQSALFQELLTFHLILPAFFPADL